MSVSKSAEIAFFGITPNPAKVQSAYLVQAEAVESYNTWSKYATTTWADMSAMKWGSDRWRRTRPTSI